MVPPSSLTAIFPPNSLLVVPIDALVSLVFVSVASATLPSTYIVSSLLLAFNLSCALYPAR